MCCLSTPQLPCSGSSPLAYQPPSPPRCKPLDPWLAGTQIHQLLLELARPRSRQHQGTLCDIPLPHTACRIWPTLAPRSTSCPQRLCSITSVFTPRWPTCEGRCTSWGARTRLHRSWRGCLQRTWWWMSAFGPGSGRQRPRASRICRWARLRELQGARLSEVAGGPGSGRQQLGTPKSCRWARLRDLQVGQAHRRYRWARLREAVV